MGGKFIKGWSKTMSILCLSSGESELGGLVRACTEGLGIKAIFMDMGIDLSIKILSDATAAIGMARRLGLGKVRHLATADLCKRSDLEKLLYPNTQVHKTAQT